MTHNRHDITEVHVGQYGTMTILVEDGDGNPLPMTDGEATFSLMPYGDREQRTADANVLLEKTVSGGGITVVDGPGGELELEITPGDWDGIDAGKYWYRIETVDGAGNPVPGAAAGLFEASYD